MQSASLHPLTRASRSLLSSGAPVRATHILQQLRSPATTRFFSQNQARNVLRAQRQQLSISSIYRSLRQQFRLRRPYSNGKPVSPNPTPHLGSPEPTGLSARLKKLSREYGWSALGVYLALSALDFPFCFLAVRLLGTERIGYAEHVVVSAFWRAVEWVVPDWVDNGKAVVAHTDGQVREGGPGWGVQEAEAANEKEGASLGTQLALAYAIHKSFIFIRVPLTAAILPKVVKTLRGWGWNIGKRATKP